MSIYTALSGATVFATGSIQWSLGLSDVSPWSQSPSRVNAAAQQITRNVLAHFINPLATPTVTASASGPSPTPSAIATPGLVQLTAPLNGAGVSGNVSISVVKAPSVSWANIYVDGNYFASTPPAIFAWDSTTVANGSHTISAQGFDNSGTPIASDAVNVLVQNGIIATPTGSPTAAPGAITLVGSTATSTIQSAVPAGVQNGDLLLAYYSFWSHATATAPNGWALLASSTASGSGVESVWYRFANNDAPGTVYNWTFNGSTPYEAGGMLAYRGVDAATLEDGSCNNQGKSTTPGLCAFSTAFGGDLYLGFFATENTNLVLPGDLNGLALNQYLSGSHFGVAVGSKTLSGPGAVPADIGSMNSGGWATVAFALKALNASPTPTTSTTPSATITRTSTVTPTPTATATVTATSVATTIAPTRTATATSTATLTAVATSTPAAIALVGSTSTISTKVTIPSGVQNGDLLLAFYSYWSFASATAPNGWTLLHSATSNGSGTETVWYRFANSDAPGSAYTWSFGGAAPYEAGGMLAYRNVDPAAFEDGFCTNQGRSATPSLCAFTTNKSNDVYVGLFATENTNLLVPTDLSGIVSNQYVAGSHFGVAAATRSLSGAGNLPADTGSMNIGGWASIAFALKGPNSNPTPTATATASTPTPTLTGTALPTVVVPTRTATATTSATTTSTATQTATATPTPIAINLVGASSTLTSKMTVPAGSRTETCCWRFTPTGHSPARAHPADGPCSKAPLRVEAASRKSGIASPTTTRPPRPIAGPSAPHLTRPEGCWRIEESIPPPSKTGSARPRARAPLRVYVPSPPARTMMCTWDSMRPKIPT